MAQPPTPRSAYLAALPDHVLDAIQEDLEEALLGSPTLTQADVAERVGISRERLDQLWVSMGFAVADDPSAVMFTEADVAALSDLIALVSSGIVPADGDVTAARVMGQSMAALAEWEVSLVSNRMLALIAASGVTGRQALLDEVRNSYSDLVPQIEALQGYVWRRHVASSAARVIGGADEYVTEPSESDGDTRFGLERRQAVVGFADIVGYTSLSRRLSPRDLADLLERFEAGAAGIVNSHRGRIIKTVGDEIMFTAEDPASGVAIALDMHRNVLSDDGDPQLRIGLGYGPVLVRFGDVYGMVVNTAARLTSSARPGSVLVDRAIVDALAEDERYGFHPLRPRRVRGIARLEPYAVRERASGETGDERRPPDRRGESHPRS